MFVRRRKVPITQTRLLTSILINGAGLTRLTSSAATTLYMSAQHPCQPREFPQGSEPTCYGRRSGLAARFPAGTEICLHSAAVRPVVGSRLPPTQFIQGFVSPGLRRRTIKLKTHLHGTVLEHSSNFIFISDFIPSDTFPASKRSRAQRQRVNKKTTQLVLYLRFPLHMYSDYICLALKFRFQSFSVFPIEFLEKLI